MMLPGRRPRGAGRRRTSPETGALRPSRGRTQRHAVVPSDAGSYPNSRGRTLEPFQRTTARIRVRPRGKRYDHPNSRTTARYEVRPRNALYDRAYPGTTARPRSPSRMRMGALRGRPGPPASLQAVADAEGGPALARAQRALHGDDGRVPVGIPAPARPGPPCAHRAHGPPRRVTGASPAQRQRGVMSRIRIGRDSPGGGMRRPTGGSGTVGALPVNPGRRAGPHGAPPHPRTTTPPSAPRTPRGIRTHRRSEGPSCEDVRHPGAGDDEVLVARPGGHHHGTGVQPRLRAQEAHHRTRAMQTYEGRLKSLLPNVPLGVDGEAVAAE